MFVVSKALRFDDVEESFYFASL